MVCAVVRSLQISPLLLSLLETNITDACSCKIGSLAILRRARPFRPRVFHTNMLFEVIEPPLSSQQRCPQHLGHLATLTCREQLPHRLTLSRRKPLCNLRVSGVGDTTIVRPPQNDSRPVRLDLSAESAAIQQCFFSHNKPANSVFSTINQRNEQAVSCLGLVSSSVARPAAGIQICLQLQPLVR
jgi:hypothetical protein